MNYIGITKPINTVNGPFPNIDYKYGPYNSIQDALDAIPYNQRSIGLTVGIKESNTGVIEEYWFNAGILSENLVYKNVGEKGDMYVPIFNNNYFTI